MGNGIVRRTIDDESPQNKDFYLTDDAYAPMQDKRLLTRSFGAPCHRSYIFADFRFERQIGSGRWSKVYLVQSMKIAPNAGFPRYAIKEVPTGQINRQQLAEFRYELNLLSHLQHPNMPRITSVYDYHGSDSQIGNNGYSRSIVYVVMEYLNGGELLPALCKQRQYMESDVLRLMRQLASAVSYLHSQGVAHGSLLPENLILTQAGSLESALRIVDFGRAESELHHHPSAVLSSDVNHLQELRVPEVLYHHIITCGYNGVSSTTTPALYRSWTVREKMAMDVWCVGAIAHLLLSGLLPGEDHPDDGAVHDGSVSAFGYSGPNSPITFKASRWTYCSDEAKAFLQYHLQVSPLDRPTIDEIVRHSWLTMTDSPTAASASEACPITKDIPVSTCNAIVPAAGDRQSQQPATIRRRSTRSNLSHLPSSPSSDPFHLDTGQEQSSLLYVDDEDDMWSVQNHYDLSTILPYICAYYEHRISTSQNAFSSLSRVSVTAQSTRYSELGERFILCEGGFPFLLPTDDNAGQYPHSKDKTLRQIWTSEPLSK
jgi:serine/threonine protein kinase